MDQIHLHWGGGGVFELEMHPRQYRHSYLQAPMLSVEDNYPFPPFYAFNLGLGAKTHKCIDLQEKITSLPAYHRFTSGSDCPFPIRGPSHQQLFIELFAESILILV